MPGIYIHIPFCKQACHYCDFHFSTSLKKKEALLVALKKELELRANELKGKEVATIYFGGGTPSLLEVDEILDLINTVAVNFQVIPNPEITLEANPDDLELFKIKELAVSGINRLSIGIQSFFDEDLRLMNRAHKSHQSFRCLELATAYFRDISIDLIYGIPGLTGDRWLKNLDTALSFDLPHISSYALTVEPRTALKSFIEKGIIPEIDEEETQAQFYTQLDILQKAGYVNYEISNFGKPGFFSKNNTAYWQGKSYLGIGPSAHSFDGTIRSWNIRNNTKYIKAMSEGVLPSEKETLGTSDRYNEYVMTGLRTIWGVSLGKIEKEFGEQYVQYILELSEDYIENQLLYKEGNVLKATEKGKFLIDGIASHLFMLKLGN